MAKAQILWATLALSALVGVNGCSTEHRASMKSATAPEQASAKAASDMQMLQGDWKGKEAGAPEEGIAHLIISGDHFQFRGGDTNEWYNGTFTLKEDTEPRQLLGTISDCPDQRYVGRTAHTIYRLKDGKLTLAAHEPGNPEPPASFEDSETRRFDFSK